MPAIRVDCVLDIQAAVGECPVWCGRTNTLYWVDVAAGTLNRFDPATGVNQVWALGEKIGSFALCEDATILVALKSGIYRYDPASGTRLLLASPERDRPDNRLNDGRCDPAGRFWVGTMRDPPNPPHRDGALYRLGSDLSCTAMVHDLTVANGLAFSPDGRILYHSDSHPSVRTIWAWDFDRADGTIRNRRMFVDTNGMPGRPDGGCCDADGCYWMAGIDGWELVRFTPTGKIDRKIRLPVAKPTMPAFGGPELDTLFVTSIRPNDTDPTDQPLAGGLFALRPGVKGLPEPRFAG